MAGAICASDPGSVLVKDGRAVLAHVPAGGDAAPVLAAMRTGGRYDGGVARALDADRAEFSNRNCASATGRSSCGSIPADPEPVERAAYDASYKGVTDVLTLYLWRRPAFYLTRWAARAGHDPQHRHR